MEKRKQKREEKKPKIKKKNTSFSIKGSQKKQKPQQFLSCFPVRAPSIRDFRQSFFTKQVFDAETLH
jgi:hypothetical protein